MRGRLIMTAVALTALGPAVAQAKPQLFVTHEGVNGAGNNFWTVAAAPDPAFFIDTAEGFGSSLAVELAFAISGSTVVSIAKNEDDWPFDNPGNNPFTDTVTFGTWISETDDNVFTAYGGNVFLSGDPVELFTMETLGSVLTTVDYGVAASGDEVNGATIAQTGQNFTPNILPLAEMMALATANNGAGGGSNGATTMFFNGYTGSATSIPEPGTMVLGVMGLLALSLGLSRRRAA